MGLIQRFFFVSLIAIFLLTLGCKREGDSKPSSMPKKNSTVVVYAEDFWWEYLSSSEGFVTKLKKILKTYGFGLKLVLTNSESATDSWKSLPLEQNPLVLLSPFTANAPVIAEHFPSTLFLVLNAPIGGYDALPRNLAVLTFDKTDAYRTAGTIIGKLLSEQNGPRPEDARSAPKKCGVLFIALSDQVRQEVGAFREGFFAESAPAFLQESEITDANDRVKIKKMIDDMRAKGVIYFLVKLYTLTGYCLDILQRDKEWAIVDDWSRAGARKMLVLFSVEEDYIGGIDGSLRVLGNFKTSWDQSRYEGPSRIIWAGMTSYSEQPKEGEQKEGE